jgi:hypothetical protein
VWEEETDSGRRRLLLDGGFRIFCAPWADDFSQDDLIRQMAKAMPPAGQWWPNGPFALRIEFPVDVATKLGLENWDITHSI